MKKLVSLMLIISIIIGSISNSFATTILPSTLEECAKDSNCIVYDSKKLKLKNNILFIPKEMVDKALDEANKDLAKIKKITGKIEDIRGRLPAILETTSQAAEFFYLVASHIINTKKYKNELGIPQLRKEIKEIKNQIKEKCKKHENCSELEDRLKSLEASLKASLATIHAKVINIDLQTLVECIFLDAITSLVMGKPNFNQMADAIVDHIVYPISNKLLSSHKDTMEFINHVLVDAQKEDVPVSLSKNRRHMIATNPHDTFYIYTR